MKMDTGSLVIRVDAEQSCCTMAWPEAVRIIRWCCRGVGDSMACAYSSNVSKLITYPIGSYQCAARTWGLLLVALLVEISQRMYRVVSGNGMVPS